MEELTPEERKRLRDTQVFSLLNSKAEEAPKPEAKPKPPTQGAEQSLTAEAEKIEPQAKKK